MMRGNIYVVGMGPGNQVGMTQEAKGVLEVCDVIVGYTTYAELLKPYFPEKEYVTTAMRQEIERCRLCYDLASQGKQVALVCSGDAGVYGMAAPMYELLPEYEMKPGYEDIQLEIVCGVTAAILLTLFVKISLLSGLMTVRRVEKPILRLYTKKKYCASTGNPG